MFTGIVEELGTVTELSVDGDSALIAVRGPLVTGDAAVGDSIAVNGCCLTVVEQSGDAFVADVMRETLARTTLGGLRPGDPVNLERAMPAGGRFGGHIVQGHVDGTGTIVEWIPGERWVIVRVTAPAALMRYLVAKGSITVDGTSLTVVDVDDASEPSFTVSLIPETLRATTLGHRAVGETVNLEVDVLAKYVERMIATRQVV